MDENNPFFPSPMTDLSTRIVPLKTVQATYRIVLGILGFYRDADYD